MWAPEGRGRVGGEKEDEEKGGSGKKKTRKPNHGAEQSVGFNRREMRPAIASNIVSTQHLKILLLLGSQAGELPPLVLQTNLAQPFTKSDRHVLRQLKHLHQLAATLLLPLTRTLCDALLLGSIHTPNAKPYQFRLPFLQWRQWFSIPLALRVRIMLV